MSEIERLRARVAALTEDCTPGPWHGVESGDRAAFGWWLENPAGDSSFPTPEDAAAMLNALPALLDVAEAARIIVGGLPDGLVIFDGERIRVLRASLARLDGAS